MAEANNIVLQLKLLWNLLIDRDNLWVNFVLKKYAKNQSLLLHKPTSLTSWQWKQLMSLSPMFCKGLRWQIGDGANISLWFDNWLFQYPIKELVDPIPGSLHLKVIDFILP